jgi:nitrile hydratase subunit beta
LLFSNEWEREVFGLALSLSKAGCFEWEDFRQNLIESIAEWENTPRDGQPRWNYYEQFFVALMKTIKVSGLLSSAEIAALESRMPHDSGNGTGHV